MKNGRKTVAWILGLLTAAALLFALLYALPVHRQLDVTMVDDAGTSSEMQLELTVSRSVFSPSRPRIQGTVVFEGRQYRSDPYYEKQRAYYFIDTEQLSEGGTAVELTQNALYFPFIDSGQLLMLQTRDGEGKTWRSYIQGT